jgi:hypothetical protein
MPAYCVSEDDNPAYFKRAVAALCRSASKEGFMFMQPDYVVSGVDEHEGKEYFRLANKNGILAIYRILNNGTLKRLKRWPAALNEY